MGNGWIGAVARMVRAELVAEGYGQDFAEINNGNCDMFADRLVTLVREQSAEGDTPDIMEAEIVSYYGPDAAGETHDNGGPFDRKLLLAALPGMTPPRGMSWDDLDELLATEGLGWGMHVFVVCDGLVYDSEAPDGVPGIFDLPFYERYLDKLEAKRSASPAVLRGP